MSVQFLPGDAVVLKGLGDASLNSKEAVLVERRWRILWRVRLDSGRRST